MVREQEKPPEGVRRDAQPVTKPVQGGLGTGAVIVNPPPTMVRGDIVPDKKG